MIAGEQHDVPARVALDDIDVLVDRVRRAEIPHRFGHALAGGKNVEAFVALRAKEIPAHLQMTDKAVGLVLRRNRDAADAGIEGVREREVDDARLSPEVDGGLGTPVSQLLEPASSSACQDKGKSRS